MVHPSVTWDFGGIVMFSVYHSLTEVNFFSLFIVVYENRIKTVTLVSISYRVFSLSPATGGEAEIMILPMFLCQCVFEWAVSKLSYGPVGGHQ